MKVLLVEDSPHASRSLARSFRETGITMVHAEDGLSGLHEAREGDFDVLLLDVMVPGMDGFQLLDTLRAEGHETPVIFLTARDGLSDRLRGLGAGGDYLVKPFAFSELLARLHNLLSRSKAAAPRMLQVGDLQLGLDPRRVHRKGVRLDLTGQEFTLLELLARHAGGVVTRTRIAEELWELEYDGDPNLVDAAIRRLRRKVDDPFDVKLIQTRRGVGYCLAAGPQESA